MRKRGGRQRGAPLSAPSDFLAALEAQRRRHATNEAETAGKDPPGTGDAVLPSPKHPSGDVHPPPPRGYVYDAEKDRLFRVRRDAVGIVGTPNSGSATHLTAAGYSSEQPPPRPSLSSLLRCRENGFSHQYPTVSQWRSLVWRSWHGTPRSTYRPVMELLGGSVISAAAAAPDTRNSSIFSFGCDGKLTTSRYENSSGCFEDSVQENYVSAGAVSSVSLDVTPRGWVCARTSLGDETGPGKAHCSFFNRQSESRHVALAHTAVKGSLWSCCWLGHDRLAVGGASSVAIVRIRDDGGSCVVQERQAASSPSDVFVVSPWTAPNLFFSGLRCGDVALNDLREGTLSTRVAKLETGIVAVFATGGPYVLLTDSGTTAQLRDSRKFGGVIASLPGYCNSHRRLGVAVSLHAGPGFIYSAGADERLRIWTAAGSLVAMSEARDAEGMAYRHVCSSGSSDALFPTLFVASRETVAVWERGLADPDPTSA